MLFIVHGVHAKGKTVNAGQSSRTQALVSTHKMVHGLENAKLRNDGALVVHGKLSGKGAVNADHVILEGIVSPGNSPGCINFGGNVTFSSTATLVTEIGGAIPCTEYDRLVVANTLTINNAALELLLINGFVPLYGQRFDVLDWGSLSGSGFASVDTSAAVLSYPLEWDLSALYLTGEVIVGVQAIADGDLAPLGAPDGVINVADILIATRIVVGNLTPGALEYAHGDMNTDGVIDTTDLILIYRLVLP